MIIKTGESVAFQGLAPDGRLRELKLHWSGGGEWRFTCGCALHPVDDNNTHGGGPHIHTEGCTEGHGEER